MKTKLFIMLLLTAIFYSCDKDDPIGDEPEKKGKISLQFVHDVDGAPMIIDTMVYTNAAGNEYLINEIQYFVSDITLHNSNGSKYVISSSNGIHYVDTDIPSTQTWQVPDDIPVGSYSSISFTFGINEVKNQSGMFTNPPEVNMFWPEFLGGGYHYLKLNGKWLDVNAMISAFNLHLGIGQIYDSVVTDSIVGYVQNYFTVNLPASSFNIAENTTTSGKIIMNVESWLDTPNVYDFDQWGGHIMQNQAAMHTIVENGTDVFTFQLNP